MGENVDAGGYVEAWESMTEVRSENDSKLKRRSLVKGIAATAICLGLSTGGASADETSEASFEVEDTDEIEVE
ncbi:MULTISPECIES: hypothetical protein [Halomicrobium]|uniref:Twin-arginine translocation signal domain-containing protein n=1 Tax=Halomicrobium mukohataei TaxID=57705 RepID=A0A847UAW5_9EURY|nr:MULTISPECIES: hypothetical protein [Halomicrobium]NLV10535.1 hypothetical protein [Halomicrobium mukohataei]